MALQFTYIEPKTGEIQHVPQTQEAATKTINHSYLEVLLGDRLEHPDTKLYVAKCYEGVSEPDLTHLKSKGVHLVLGNGRTAYFADAETAQYIRNVPEFESEIESLFSDSFSDAIAYGSLPVSEAKASVVRKGRVLVIDDERVDSDGNYTPDWGTEAITFSDGTPVDPEILMRATNALGDSYSLISKQQHRQLNQVELWEGLEKQVELKQLAIAQTGTLSTDIDLSLLATEQSFETPDDPNRVAIDLLEDQIQDALELSLTSTQYQPGKNGNVILKWAAQTETGEAIEGQSILSLSAPGSVEFVAVGGTISQQQQVKEALQSIRKADQVNTPFQFRAGTPQWAGIVKGDCRSSDLCEQLGVDAIIPKSAIKGDGKTVELGIHEVDSLFWSKKTEAKINQQRLGAQVLVNFPQGTEHDIEPKLKQRIDELAEAQSDPREVAKLYIAKVEKGLVAEVEYGTDEEGAEEAQEDWLYTILKADVMPSPIVVGLNPTNVGIETPQGELAAVLSQATYTALVQTAEAGLTVEEFVEQANQLLEQEEILHNDSPATYYRFSAEELEKDGANILQLEGNAELLEHPKVVEKLEEFLQGEWRDAALGGVEVPSAVAQPHRGLKRGEVCFPEMPHGARVAVYRSPVANSANFRTMTNNTADIREQDREAFYQQGVVYLHPEDAKELLIDFDGDAPAIIPEEQFAQRVEPQRLESLKSHEICIPTLPHGQKVTLYHSDRQKNTFINNTSTVPDDAGKKQIYLNPGTLKGMKLKSPMSYGYTTEDGLVGFKALLNEIDELNLPENQPVKVEKEKKIVRDANHPSVAKLSLEEQAMAAKFTSIEAAFIDASNNPTGEVANVGMRIEALRQELLNATVEKQAQLVREISSELTKRFATQAGGPNAQPGIGINHSDGKAVTGANRLTSDINIPLATAQYDFREGVEHAVNASKYITSNDPQIRERQIKTQVHEINQLLFQAQGLVATQLQRAVDTPKSARTVDESVMRFAKALCYKRVEWVAHKKDKDLYTTRKATPEDVKAGLAKTDQEWVAVPLTNNTTDPVGKLVAQANTAFQGTHLEKQEIQAFRDLLNYEYAPEQAEVVQAVVGQYNQTIRTASELEKKAEVDKGPRLILTSQSGNSMEITNLTTFDPKGTSPIWDAIRKQEPIDIKVVANDKTLGKLPKGSKAFFTQETHAYAVQATLADGSTHTIGTLSKESQLDLAYRKLEVDARTDPKARQIKQDVDKSRQALKYQNGQDKDAKEKNNIERKLNGQDITNRNVKKLTPALAPAFGKEEAKEMRSSAVKTVQEWAKQVHPSDAPAIATALSHNQGPKLALSLFPEFIAEHLQNNHTITAKLNGLQYGTNQCDQMRWDGEQAYPVRVAVDLIPNPKSQTANEQAVIQVQLEGEWKTLAPLNKEGFIPPIGMSGVARIQEAFLQVKTPQHTFSIDASKHGAFVESTANIQFWHSANETTVFAWTTGESPQCIGELSKKDISFLKTQQSREGTQIIGNGNYTLTAQITPKTAVVEIESGSVVMPEQWTKRKDLQLDIPLEQVQAQLTAEVAPQSPQKPAQSFDPAIPPTAPSSRPVEAKTPQSEAKQEAPQTQKQPAPSSEIEALREKYEQAQQSITALYQAMGHTPTPEQVDAAIALKVYQSNPKEKWLQELRILGQSPQTQQIKAEKGEIAAIAYVQGIMDVAQNQLKVAQTAKKRSGYER